MLGSSMWALAREYDWSKLLVEIAHPDLNLLATRINETAHLAVREGKDVLFIDSAHASRVIAAVGRTGDSTPFTVQRTARRYWRTRTKANCVRSSDRAHYGNLRKTR